MLMTVRETTRYLAVLYVGLILGAVLENNYGSEQYTVIDHLIALCAVFSCTYLARAGR